MNCNKMIFMIAIIFMAFSAGAADIASVVTAENLGMRIGSEAANENYQLLQNLLDSTGEPLEIQCSAGKYFFRIMKTIHYYKSISIPQENH